MCSRVYILYSSRRTHARNSDPARAAIPAAAAPARGASGAAAARGGGAAPSPPRARRPRPEPRPSCRGGPRHARGGGGRASRWPPAASAVRRVPRHVRRVRTLRRLLRRRRDGPFPAPDPESVSCFGLWRSLTLVEEDGRGSSLALVSYSFLCEGELARSLGRASDLWPSRPEAVGSAAVGEKPGPDRSRSYHKISRCDKPKRAAGCLEWLRRTEAGGGVRTPSEDPRRSR